VFHFSALSQTPLRVNYRYSYLGISSGLPLRMGLVSSEWTLLTIAVVAMMVDFALIIYLYQLWQDKAFKQPQA
jgi:hypothetical protein